MPLVFPLAATATNHYSLTMENKHQTRLWDRASSNIPTSVASVARGVPTRPGAGDGLGLVFTYYLFMLYCSDATGNTLFPFGDAFPLPVEC